MATPSWASYAWGQCTYYVAKTLSWIPGGLGNATDWVKNAQTQGFSISKNPVAGSAVVWNSSYPGSGGYGHTAVVQSVNPNGSFTVGEMNVKGVGVYDSRTITNLNYVEGFILPKDQSLLGQGVTAANPGAAGPGSLALDAGTQAATPSVNLLSGTTKNPPGSYGWITQLNAIMNPNTDNLGPLGALNVPGAIGNAVVIFESAFIRIVIAGVGIFIFVTGVGFIFRSEISGAAKTGARAIKSGIML